MVGKLSVGNEVANQGTFTRNPTGEQHFCFGNRYAVDASAHRVVQVDEPLPGDSTNLQRNRERGTRMRTGIHRVHLDGISQGIFPRERPTWSLCGDGPNEVTVSPVLDMLYGYLRSHQANDMHG